MNLTLLQMDTVYIYISFFYGLFTFQRKRRRKEKRGETTNTSVEMDSLAAINIDEAITKIYGR